MQQRRVWLLVLVFPIAFLVKEYRSQQVQNAALREEVAAMREQQDRLAVQLSRQPLVARAPLAATPATATATTASQAPTAGLPSSSEREVEDPAARLQRWDDEHEAYMTAIEGAFAAERTDAAWAGEARATLQHRLGALSYATSSSLGQIDCRASLCRVEVTHQSATEVRQFNEKAFALIGDRVWDGPAAITYSPANADGSLVAVLYLGRKGTELVKRE